MQTTATLGSVLLRSPPQAATSLCGKATPPGPKPGGFFTAACGLGTHPPGPGSGVFSPISALFLCAVADGQSAESARQSP